MENAKYWNFAKSKGLNTVKNGKSYTKFHFSMYNLCNMCKENELKLQYIEIFKAQGA